MGNSDTPIAPKTILTLKREPIWPLSLSAPSRTRLRVRISENTSSAATIKVESAKKTTKAFPCCGRNGMLSDPSVNTAAASSTTTIPPIASQRSLLRRRFTLPALLKVSPERALVAQGIVRAAVILSGVDDQGVKFVEAFYVTRKLALEHPADIVIFCLFSSPTVAQEHALGVGIDDERRVITCIQKNGIGRLRTDAEDAKQLFPQHDRGSFKHALKRAAVLGVEELAKCLQLPRLLPEIAGRAYQPLQTSEGNTPERSRGQQVLLAQARDRALDVRPGSVLGQDRADDNLELRSAGPPVLWTQSGKQGIVVFIQWRPAACEFFAGSETSRGDPSQQSRPGTHSPVYSRRLG